MTVVYLQGATYEVAPSRVECASDCPACGAPDMSVFASTPVRAEWDLSDMAECSRCGLTLRARVTTRDVRRAQRAREACVTFGVTEDPEVTHAPDVSACLPERDAEGCDYGDSWPCPWRWLAVTVLQSSGSVCAVLCDTLAEAREIALRYVADDLATEYPLAIVDLDSGREQLPRWDRLTWRQA